MAATRFWDLCRRYQPRISYVPRLQRVLPSENTPNLDNNDNKALLSIPQQPSEELYKHAITPRSPHLLACLPTEIVDQIFSHLDEKHWHTLRLTHRLFKHSVQAAIFQRVTLCNFRGTRGPSGAERLLSLLKDDERLRDYICEVRLTSLLDPTVSKQIERLLPEILVLLKPRRFIIAFRELQGATRDTQENCVRMLFRLLKDVSLPPLTIEHDGPCAPIINGINQLGIETVYLTGEPYTFPEAHTTFNQPWLDSLKQSTLKRLDLGEWQVLPEDLTDLFNSLTGLTAFSMTVNRTASHAALVGLLRSKVHVLRELSLRRLPICRQNMPLPALLDLSAFEVLGKLTINGSFLFGAAYCSPSNRPLDKGPNPYVRELIARAEAAVLLPPHLRNLTITFNRPQAVFSLGEDTLHSRSQHVPRGIHGLEFDWMLEIVRRQQRLQNFELIEERHIHEHTASPWNPPPAMDECELVKFTMPDVMRELFTELGCQMRIWVQYKVPSAV